jgi:DNA-binding NarL/FixJ family response regulator/tetratricopeptide (TPR) repeat protein/type II secretory pathway predicted ATPase ExeA
VISSAVLCRELIGRSSELEHLLAAVRQAPASRSSAVVVIRGEAGVGKTRLAKEFGQRAEAEGVHVVACAAREYASASYAPIIDAAEQLGAATAFGPSEGGADSDAVPDDKTRRFAAVADQFAALGAKAARGVAVILEDLHWADGGTLELLRFLGARLAHEPVLFVLTYRLEDVEAHSARSGALTVLEREAGNTITLEPLRDEQIERLLRSIIRDAQTPVAAALIQEVRDLSDGRPLFAEELLRGVFERIARDGTARAIVPTSIRATVRERFAELAPADRDVVLHAAVVGKRFSARFLTKLVTADAAAVFRALRRARDLQLIVEEGDDDGDAFAFRHALTREAVYGELLRAEARVLHALVASALAHERALDVPAIAEHTYRARDAEHALAWNERAGDAAVEAFAHADAARYYERAHEFAAGGQQRGELAEKIAEAFYATGALEQTANWLSRAIDDFELLGDTTRVLQLASRRARILWEADRRDEGIDELRALAERLPDDATALRFEVETMLGGLLNGSGRAGEALEHLESAEALIEHAESGIVTRFHGIRGYALALVGRYSEARGSFGTAIARAKELGDDDVLLRTLNNFGNAELSGGAVFAARSLYGEALEVAERTKNMRVVAWVSQNAALAALAGGDLRAVQSHLERSRLIAHEVQLVHRWCVALTLRLATLLGEARDDERAAATAALEQSLRAGDESSIGALAAALAYDALAADRPGDAQALIRAGLAKTTSAQSPYWIVAVASRAGDAPERARARTLLQDVPGGDEALGARGVLALAHAHEALRKRKRDEADAYATEAVRLFRGAGWVLDEAAALEAAGRVAEAVAILRRAGAAAEVRRLTQTGVAAPRRRGEATLTTREREIVNLVLAGRTAREIAETLVISDRTVETHVAKAYRKLGVTNRAELSTLVVETALTAP